MSLFQSSRHQSYQFKVEPSISSYQITDPNSRKRPDIVITDPNFIADLDKSNLDYTLRSPITGNPTMNNAKDHPMKLAVNARHEKVTEYLPSHVIPLVNIWPGLMDKETEALLDRLCSYIKQLDSLPLYNIKQFILKRIAFVLFKGFANNVIYNNRRLYLTLSEIKILILKISLNLQILIKFIIIIISSQIINLSILIKQSFLVIPYINIHLEFGLVTILP